MNVYKLVLVNILFQWKESMYVIWIVHLLLKKMKKDNVYQQVVHVHLIKVCI